MVPRHLLYPILVAPMLSATFLPVIAQAASSGLDTAPNVGTLPFSIEGEEIMDLTKTGLGIGTASPLGQLSLSSDAADSFNVGVTTNAANSTAQIANDLYVIAAGSSSRSSQGSVAYNYYNAGSNPSYSGALLNYYGAAYTGNVNGVKAANQGALLFQNTAANVVASNTGNLTFSPSGVVTMTVESSGHVGIGTESPQTTLDVNGPISPGLAATGANCSPIGAIAHDSTGAPLFCVNGTWASMKPSTTLAVYYGPATCATGFQKDASGLYIGIPSSVSCPTGSTPVNCGFTQTVQCYAWGDGGTTYGQNKGEYPPLQNNYLDANGTCWVNSFDGYMNAPQAVITCMKE